MKIVLASKSPRRKDILKRMGYTPVIRVSNCDESKVREKDPKELVKKLSRLKAEDIAQSCKPGELVLGSDTVVALDEKILGKPKTPRDAVRMIRSIAGRSHVVYTGVTLILKGDPDAGDKAGKRDVIKTFYDSVPVTVNPMSDEEIREYVATGEPMDKAGGYGIQGPFCKFVKKINGDFYTVEGLPSARTYQEIRKILQKGKDA